VRKIISILVALGLVLALSAVATPVAAKITGVSFTVVPNCAGQVGVWNISFTTSASLTEGLHEVCIVFPDGTEIPPTGAYPAGAWKKGDIEMDGIDVFAEEITVTGTTVCFLVPVDFTAGAHFVTFTSDACIVNPPPSWKYVSVYTSREPDSTPVASLYPKKIIPCESSYGFYWDSSPTYPGIAPYFVPPFKMCGQANNTTIGIEGAVAHPYIADGYMNAFNLTFEAYPVGCEAPCENVTITVSLVASPQFPCLTKVSTVTLNLTDPGGTYTMTTKNLTWDPCTMVEPAEIDIAVDMPLAANTAIEWAGLIHFDTVGEYTLCFKAVCPGGATCEPPDCTDGGLLLAEDCFDFTVHQWKDANKIELDEKWNLISLPLVPFDTDIDALLASLSSYALDGDGCADLVSIWHYDRCLDEWFVHGNGQSSLTDMVDGDAYWVRMTYPMGDCRPIYQQLLGICVLSPASYNWWVFGTHKAMPPAAPSAYPVCAGWNMIGFTSWMDDTMANYLWNFGGGLPEQPYPLVYGWDNTGDWLTSGWKVVTSGDNFEVGQGYWAAFGADGTIFP
jgi:hypothetical protein